MELYGRGRNWESEGGKGKWRERREGTGTLMEREKGGREGGRGETEVAYVTDHNQISSAPWFCSSYAPRLPVCSTFSGQNTWHMTLPAPLLREGKLTVKQET